MSMSPTTPNRRAKKQRPLAEPSSRVFVGSLPFVVDATAVRDALAAAAGAAAGSCAEVEWLRDRESGLFYGSAFVQMGSVEAATTAVGRSRDCRGEPRDHPRGHSRSAEIRRRARGAPPDRQAEAAPQFCAAQAGGGVARRRVRAARAAALRLALSAEALPPPQTPPLPLPRPWPASGSNPEEMKTPGPAGLPPLPMAPARVDGVKCGACRRIALPARKGPLD